MTRVAVVGAGSWGTTVASVAAHNAATVIWARSEETAREIDGEHSNRAYLGSVPLTPSLRGTSSLRQALDDADLVLMAIPSHGFRSVLEMMRGDLRRAVPVISLTKGIAPGSLQRMTELIAEVLPGHPSGVLTGPNIANEVVRGYAAAAVVAMTELSLAKDLQALLRTSRFRVYTSTDVIGAELGGALKNVFAVAAGMAQGLGAGDNTRGAVITRALREITCLGTAAGGQMETFLGLAGVGDLLATCMSPSSRNRTLGEKLAQGQTLEEATGPMRMVAEAVRTAPAVMALAERHQVELPIAREVAAVMRGAQTPAGAFRGLLRTTPTSELVPG